MMRENDNNLLEVLQTLYKRRKFIIILCSVVVLGSAGISLFLPDYYQATTSFYPASPSLIDPNRVYATSESGVEYYGGDDEVNQLLSAAKSKVLLDYVIKTFNLYEVYEIDSTKQKAPFKVRKKLLKRYTVLKNANDGIDVSIEDTNRERAAQMANAIRAKIDEIHRNFLRSSQQLVLDTHTKSLAQRRRNLTAISDSLYKVRQKYQIYNAEAQSEFLSSYVPKIQAQLALTKGKLQFFKSSNQRDSVRYYTAKASALQKQLNSVTKDDGSGTFNLESLNKGMALTILLEEQLERLSKDISEQDEVYLRFDNIMNASVSSLVGVEIAEVPVVKSRPRRTIIVFSAGLIAFLLSAFGVLLYENYNHINWENITKKED